MRIQEYILDCRQLIVADKTVGPLAPEKIHLREIVARPSASSTMESLSRSNKWSLSPGSREEINRPKNLPLALVMAARSKVDYTSSPGDRSKSKRFTVSRLAST